MSHRSAPGQCILLYRASTKGSDCRGPFVSYFGSGYIVPLLPVFVFIGRVKDSGLKDKGSRMRRMVWENRVSGSSQSFRVMVVSRLSYF
jgi:hypothetical protein